MKKLDASQSDAPRYQQVAQQLALDIRNQRYQINEMLPTEKLLCERFGVSRHTIREAIRVLQVQGLVSRRQGSGTMVVESDTDYSYVQTLSSVSELLQYAEETQLHVLKSEMIRVTEDTAKLLQCSCRQERLKIEGVRSIGNNRDNPFCWSEIYIKPQYAEVMDYLTENPESIFRLIEEHFGESTNEVRQEISAVVLTEEMAERLNCEPGTAGLSIIRRYFGVNDNLFEVTRSIFPADRFSYTTRIRLGSRPHAE